MKKIITISLILIFFIQFLPAGASAVRDITGVISSIQEPPGNRSGTLRVYVLTGENKGKTMNLFMDFTSPLELYPDDIIAGEFVGTDWVMKYAKRKVKITYVQCLDDYGSMYYDVMSIKLVK